MARTITVETYDEQEAYWEGLAAAMLPTMSHGTLGIFGDFEYFQVDDLIYRANAGNPLDTRGYRQGARFECRADQWNYMRGVLEKLAA